MLGRLFFECDERNSFCVRADSPFISPLVGPFDFYDIEEPSDAMTFSIDYVRFQRKAYPIQSKP